MAAPPSLDSLNVSEDRKKYILDKLNPLLEEFVTKMLTELDPNPLGALASFAREKKGMSDSKLNGQNEKLKKDIELLKYELQNMAKTVCTTDDLLGGEKEPEAEEEEEEDDDCEDLPEDFLRPDNQYDKVRTSVSAEAYGAWNTKKAFTAPVYEKTAAQKERLSACITKSFLFAALEQKDLDTVIGAMQEKVVDGKKRVMTQGEDGEYLFVIEEGILDCYKLIDGAEKLVKTCETGDTFGELALLYNCPRAASVESREKCILWQLDRETFSHIVKDAASKKRERYDAFIKQVPLLSSMDAYERSQLADALMTETFEAGAKVVLEDDPGDKFFIIEEGEAYAEKKNVGQVMEYKPGEYFGELALLRNQPRAATVVAKSKLTVLTLGRSSFKRLLGPLDDILTRAISKYEEH
jgi:cAMP-dependent protein kinase regulator